MFNNKETDLIEKSSNLSKEQQVSQLIRQIEIPFLKTLAAEFSDDSNWLICGPASIALSRIISHTLVIPIGRDLIDEHLELAIAIYDPKNIPDQQMRIEAMGEQTYIRYYPKDPKVVYYIDPIYRLLTEEQQELNEAIIMEKYTPKNIDTELAKRHYLYPFNPYHKGIETIRIFNGLTAKQRQIIYQDTVAALNDERARMNGFLSDLGRPMVSLWAKTENIIRQFCPSWKRDETAMTGRMNALMTTYSQHWINCR